MKVKGVEGEVCYAVSTPPAQKAWGTFSYVKAKKTNTK